MTEHDHDEIGRRLRETGTVSAPERLRADVMDQVRAEPRPRPSRRSFLAPVIPYAAAAAILAALVLALTHLDGSGGGSASGGGGSAAGGSFAHAPETAKDAAGNATDKLVFSVSASAAQRLSLGQYARRPADHTIVLAVPSSRLNHYKRRLRAIEQRTHGTGTVKVILRAKR